MGSQQSVRDDFLTIFENEFEQATLLALWQTFEQTEDLQALIVSVRAQIKERKLITEVGQQLIQLFLNNIRSNDNSSSRLKKIATVILAQQQTKQHQQNKINPESPIKLPENIKIVPNPVVKKQSKIKNSNDNQKFQKVIQDLNEIITGSKIDQVLDRLVQYCENNLRTSEFSQVRKQLFPILFDFFRIQINGLVVQKNDISEQMIKSGKQKFELFLIFLGQVCNSDLDNFYEYSQQAISSNKNAYYWTDKDQNSIIQINLKLIKDDSSKDKFLLIFQNFHSCLTQKMYSRSPTRTLLWTLLENLQHVDKKYSKQICIEISTLLVSQNVNLEQLGNQDSPQSYKKQLISILGQKQFQQLFSNKFLNKKKNNLPKFMLIDQKNKQKKDLQVSPSIQQQIEHFLIGSSDRNIKIKEQNTQISLLCEDSAIKIKYSSGLIIKQGILIPRFGNFNDKIAWKIFDAKYFKVIDLTDQQAKKVKDKLLSQHQSMLKLNKFRLQINSEDLLIKIMNQGQLEQINQIRQGYIFWLPLKCCYPEDQPNIVQQADTEDDNLVVAKDPTTEFFQPAQDKIQILLNKPQQKYPYLGTLVKYMDIPTDIEITVNEKDNMIVAVQANAQEFVKNWINQQSLEAFKNCFEGDQNAVHLEINVNGPQNILRKISDYLKKLAKQKNFHISHNIQKNQLSIDNIKQDPEYAKDFCNYLINIQQSKQDKTETSISFDRKDANLVQEVIKKKKQNQSEIQPILFDDEQNNKSVITAQSITVEDEKQLLDNLAALLQEQQHSVLISEANALKMLKQKSPNTIAELDIKIKDIDKSTFEATGLPKNLYNFYNKLIQYIKIYNKIKYNEAMDELVLPGKAKDYKIYQSILKSIPKTQVKINKSDLVIISPKTQIQNIAIKICKEYIQKLIQVQSLNAYKFHFKYIKHDLAFSIKRILEQELKNIKNDLPPILDINRAPGDEGFIFELKSGNQMHKQTFVQIVKTIVIRFTEYCRIWKQLRRTNTFVNSKILPLRRIQTKQTSMRLCLNSLITSYSTHINEQVKYIVEEDQRVLYESFIEFVEKNMIKQKFTWKPRKSLKDQLITRNQGVFKSFLNKQIEKYTQKSAFLSTQIKKKVSTIQKFTQQKITKIDKCLINDSPIDPKLVLSLIISIKTMVKLFLTLNLPIIESLDHFSKMIDVFNTIVVKTGTGSGKSTVLPPFMVALGYSRVIVTQPRRLPCRAIYNRICNTFDQSLVGYSYSGDSVNNHHPLHYTTDGLLKQLLMKVPKIIKNIDVLMLDQIHERSKGIDLILTQIVSLRKINPKLKVILCSATVDESIVNLVEPTNLYGVFKVEIQTHPVKQYKIQRESIVDKAAELAVNLNKDQKMLVFFAGIDQIRKNVQIFKQKYKKKAFPLYGSQSTREQDDHLEKGQIFFATSIAETSLTFSNLKYVLDTRKSRISIFNLETGLNQLVQYPASESSIKQRKGRVGRDCPGQYYYQEIVGNQNIFTAYNLTEIQRTDISNVIFELLQTHNTFQQATDTLKSLMTNLKKSAPGSLILNKKFQNAKKILQFYKVIDSSGKVTRFCRNNLHKYGNLGSISYNYALYESENQGCSFEMIAIISLLMFGSNILSSVLGLIPGTLKHPSGDIMSISNFLINLSNRINLKIIKQKNIHYELNKVSSVQGKPWLPTLVRVLKFMKKLMNKMDLYESKDWSVVQSCLIRKAFRNNLYFKEEIMGGRKNNYQKISESQIYCFEKQNLSKIFYRVNKTSLIEDKTLVSNVETIISLSAFCNAIDDGMLAFCSKVEIRNIENKIRVKIVGTNPDGLNIKNQQNILAAVTNYKESYNWPNLILQGNFYQVSNEVKNIEQQRKNNEYVIQLFPILQNKTAKIKEQHKKMLKQFLQNEINLYQVFASLKFECENIHNCKMKFDSSKNIKLQNAKASTIQLVMQKVNGFFMWFIKCQHLCGKDAQVPVRQLKRDQKILQPKIKQIEKRINMIVDSELQFHILKNWASSPHHEFSPRVMRMVAVSWVLVNKFHCKIKGGFIRDWVIRGKEWLPPLKAGEDYSNLMKICARNGYLEVDNQLITPSDIDAELPLGSYWFNCKYFENEMKYLGIKIKIEEDGWRKHIIFDEKSPSGGFTVDLIEAYSYISYDQVDYDVNAFYIEKDHLGALGLKIPMKLRQLSMGNGNGKEIEIELQSLVQSCIKNEMRQLKVDIFKERREKFERRGWKISAIVYEPTIHKNYKTTYYQLQIGKFNNIFPTFKQNLPNAKIQKVEILKNYVWQAQYDANIAWILQQNSQINEKLLFHGTDPAGKEGIYKAGFDSRYLGRNGSYFGIGIYFADTAALSHSYTRANANGDRYMFVCWVALGKQEQIEINHDKKGPEPGYHSVLGRKSPTDHWEYIVNRTGQGRPIYLITYRL